MVHVDAGLGNQFLAEPWWWLEFEKQGVRAPVLFDLRASQPCSLEPEEFYGVIGASELRRMCATLLAGDAAVFAAVGCPQTELTLPDAGPDAARPQYVGRFALPPDLTLPIPALTAARLAGQVALEIYLERSWLRDPRRVMGTWVISLPLAAQITSHVESCAFLYGRSAKPPTDWTGSAVHIDHLREHVRAWLEGHWESVDVLARHLVDHGRADAGQITVMIGHGSGIAPIAPLPPDHPLFQFTEIPDAAVAAAAAWWTETLRGHLSSEDGPSGPEPRPDGQAWWNGVVEPETFDRLRQQLAADTKAAIELRTGVSDGGLDVRRDAEGTATYRLGMLNYDPCYLLGRAMQAVGLSDHAIIGSRGKTVEISAHQVVAVDCEDKRSVLWTSPYGAHALR